VRKDDPLEEMQELFGEIKIQETKFKKALEVCGKLLSFVFMTYIFIISIHY
jgi:hypothetical protein